MNRGKRLFYIAFGLLVALASANIFLSGYYFQKHQEDVRITVASYIKDVTSGAYNSAYSYFSSDLKERLSKEQFEQNVILSIRDSGDFVGYEIIQVRIGNSIGTRYIGPEAKVVAKIEQTERQILEEFILLRHDNRWEINQAQVYSRY